MNNNKIEAVYGLTAMQEGMLYHSLVNKDVGTDLVQIQTTIEGKLNTNIFEQSVNAVIGRHSTLRAIFLYENLDELKQVVINERRCKVDVDDLRSLPEGEQLKTIELYLENNRENKMNLSKSMLFRAHIFIAKDEEYQIIFTFHHIILDGWSVGIVMSEIYHIYDCLLAGSPVDLGKAYDTGQYLKWVDLNCNKGESFFYWKQMLKGYDESVEIPKYLSGNINAPYVRKDIEFLCSEKLTEKMNNYCKKNHCTLSSFVHAICGVLIQKYSNRNDVVFGTVVSGRPSNLQNVDKMVGLLINTIPFRVKTEEGQTFEKLLSNVQQHMLAAEKHSYLQLAEVQNISSLKNDLLHFVIAFENYYTAVVSKEYKEYNIKKSIAFEQTNYDISIVFIPGDRFKIKTTYNESLYDKRFIEEIGEHFNNIASAVINSSDICVNEINYLAEDEEKKVIYHFNDTKHTYSESKLLHQMFEENADRNPDNIAVVCGEKKISYKDLNANANRLAHCIRSSIKGKSEPVAILIDRGIDLVEGVLAVLKANAMYVPFESSHPVLRMVKAIEDLHIKQIIISSNQKNKLDDIMQHTSLIERVYVIDGFETGENIKKLVEVQYFTPEDFEKESDWNQDNIIDSSARAYVIYTSGSTGKPKGVVVQHKPVVNVIEFLNREYDIDEKDSILFVTSICFDLSIYDIWGMLAAGGTIEVVPLAEMLNHHYIMGRLCSGDITLWDSAPSVIQQLIPLFSEYGETSKSRLRRVLTGGDWVDLHLSEEIKKISPDAKVTALGGATEATIYSNYYDIEEVNPGWVSIPYGKPIQNALYYVLDSKLRPQPIGIKGDLYIGGECLAECYINDENLTGSKFIPNPFDENRSVMYKTGDSARWYYDGNLEFLGRNDFQVKIKGYRIESGEIEYHLKKYNGISDAIVLAMGTAERDRLLVAYYITERKIGSEELIEYLRQHVPEYMIPKFLIPLLEFPLNDNGKIDRESLPQPKRQLTHSTSILQSENQNQEKIREVWAEILGLPKQEISIDDVFNEIGGHSLLVIKLEVELKKKKILSSAHSDFIQLGNRCTIRNIDAMINNKESVVE